MDFCKESKTKQKKHRTFFTESYISYIFLLQTKVNTLFYTSIHTINKIIISTR